MHHATPAELASWVHDARERTIELVTDLTDDELMGPRITIVNPLIWEIGHVAWFQERWALRHAYGERPLRKDADTLWDSMAIPHDTRWDLPLLSRKDTLSYMRDVRDRVVERLGQDEPDETFRYFVMYSVFHEDMHTEAFTYTRQTLSYPAPRISIAEASDTAGTVRGGGGGGSTRSSGPLEGDVEVPGGTFMLGALHDESFVFDNEKWAHAVELEPFGIARAPVTQSEFAAFVDDRGYHQSEFWSDAGWRWREEARAEHPVYWRREVNGRWSRRDFETWVELEPHRPVIHVNWHEAEAYCRWAKRRLPSEAEWEAAAVAAAGPDGGSRSVPPHKRRFPWGDEAPTPARANLDWHGMGCADVAAHPDGDSAYGCRQMIGNVWEWTSSDFLPYPGFEIDPYKEYSEPWFGTRKVLRGGCWVTRGRMLRNTWRNFYTPDRRDVWAGFRTCASGT